MSEVGFKPGRQGGVLHTLDHVSESAPMARCGDVIEIANPAPKPGEFKRWCRLCPLPADEIAMRTANMWRRSESGDLVPANGFRPRS
jgi:hypothetical protein